MPPVIKTTVRNGHRLVHRVEKDNAAVHVPTQVMLFTHPTYDRRLIRTSDLIYRLGVWITLTFLRQG